MVGLLSLAEARDYLQMSQTTFRRRVRPAIPVVEIGSRVLVDKEDLDKWSHLHGPNGCVPKRKAGRKPKPGPTLREHKSGFYYVRFTFDGRRHEISTGSRDINEASERADLMFQMIARPRQTEPLPVDGPGVYAIRCIDRVKIGKTHLSIRKRFNAVAQGLPAEAVLIGAISLEPDDETLFHELFAPLREKGEWFGPAKLVEDALHLLGCIG